MFGWQGRAAVALPEEAGAERRRSFRQATVFQVAKLVTGRFEELCVIRDISAGGLKADSYRPVTPGERIAMELRTEHRLTGTVAWQQDEAFGMQFDAEVSVSTMLAHCSIDDRIRRIRQPRIACDLPGELRLFGDRVKVRIVNISQAGMQLMLPELLGSDGHCEIVVPELGRRRATIRWHRAAAAGLMLADPLTYDDFVAWRRRLLAGEAAA